ncbi:hypothetical protein BH09ACT1_BH09ACT1_23880 [soil metagenome]
MGTRWGRVARGWIVALFATVIAVCSHTIAGGVGVSGIGVLISFVFSGFVCLALAGRSLSRVRLAIAVTISQFAFHLVFSYLAAPSATGPAVTLPGMNHMTDAAAQLTALDTGSHSATMASPDATMWFAHAIAAVLTMLVLVKGERAFWALVQFTRVVVIRILAAVVPAVTSPRLANAVAVDRAALPLTTRLLLSTLRHRGPPAFAA